MKNFSIIMFVLFKELTDAVRISKRVVLRSKIEVMVFPKRFIADPRAAQYDGQTTNK